MDTYKFSVKQLCLFVVFLFCIPINSQPKWLKVTNQECTYFEPYYEKGMTATWSGGSINGKANGNGTLDKYINGRKYGSYQGQIVEGQIQGMADYTVYFENGGRREFKGNFESGELIGEGSQIDYFPNGKNSTYKGNFVNYQIHGNGLMILPDGSIFEGLFYMNQAFTGKFKDKNNTIWLYQGSRVDKLPKLPKSTYSPQLFVQQTEYFDENWSRCSMSNAKYYRLITYKAPNRPQGVIKDFYISGEIQSEFECAYINYDEDRLNFSIGDSKWYYENGQISRVCHYKNNVVIGKDINYYENGQESSVITYDDKGVIVSANTWFKSGKPNMVAEYQNGRLVNDRFTEYDENGIACQVMKEDFNFNKQTWENEDNNGKSQVISNNAMTFTGKLSNSTIRTNYIQVNQDQDFSIEGSVYLLDDKDTSVGYGLMLGFRDWSNYLFFIVSGNGQYKIQNTYEGINIPITDWKSSTSINTGKAQNLLKVMKISDKMVFSINGTMVDKIDAPVFRGNNYGMIIGGKGEFALENFTYREYVSNSNTSTAQTRPSDKSSSEVSIDGNGTGFFIDKRGYVATNHHVTNGAKGIYVCIQNEGVWASYHAIVVKSDPTNDLSIIKIDAPDFKPFSYLPYDFTTNVEDIASEIYTLGYPQVHVMGSDVKYTAGTINSKTGIQGDPTHYQISAHIDHGNSGGPMFNSKGSIIGITDSGLDKAEFGDVNYAIKSSYLKSLVDALPVKLNLPNDKTIANLSRVEQIKRISKYTALILVDLP